ncbi:hypothetical protein B0A50_00490 [Salinomyces thailandicus]|uniref:MT-A70-domain-containing protein n=1 Tax=Salinomyces thailandicus TaxID=706561 RepID=A0A4U0UE14_9PEZI|nr:hypothetical protein B0A50_00490 [Salinomyces thailandica]
MTSPVLWQNADQTVALIDIPRSIEAAQGTLQQPCHDNLLSIRPLESPFPANEPKSEKARAKVAGNTTDQQLHEQYADILEHALAEVRYARCGEWCLPRPFVQESMGKPRKRKVNDLAKVNDAGVQSTAPGELTMTALRSLVDPDLQGFLGYRQPSNGNEDVPTERNGVQSVRTQQSHNPSHHAIARLEVNLPAQDCSYHFRLPPLSSYFLADCSESASFRAAVRSQAQDTGSKQSFNLIVIDPPWPNRSVKRTHKTPGSSYATISTVADVKRLVLGMDLDMLMAEKCLVAIWITNSPAVRDLVLGDNGIFECWGIELTEEWLWLKTTSHGQPVSNIGSLWRKPYEVLLLGRKRKTCASADSAKRESRRRVLIGVPDLHSRKPCLKELISPLMENASQYRALEVFARHLVAGWWSWGDECLKFNWEGSWRSQADVCASKDDHLKS